MPVLAGSKIRAADFSLTIGQKLRCTQTTSGTPGKPLKASQK